MSHNKTEISLKVESKEKIDSVKINQIYQGDCFKILDKIPKHSIDLVVTDPPFFVMNKKNLDFKNRANIVQNADFDGFSSYKEFLDFTSKWSSLVNKVLKEDSSVYIFFGAQYITDLMKLYLDLGFKYKGILVWHKTNPVPKIRKNGYLSSTELILFMSKGNPTFNFLGQKKMHNMIETPICMRPERLVDRDPSNNKDRKYPSLHPTQKPIKVIKKLIKISSNPGQVVLDPFAGTGTTNVASKKLGRFCIGIEKNKKYHRAAIKRVNKTKKEPNEGKQSELDSFFSS